MNKFSKIIFCSLLFLFAFNIGHDKALAVPAINEIVADHERGVCASFWSGDEWASFSLKKGWVRSSYGECKELGYEFVQEETANGPFPTKWCLDNKKDCWVINTYEYIIPLLIIAFFVFVLFFLIIRKFIKRNKKVVRKKIE